MNVKVFLVNSEKRGPNKAKTTEGSLQRREDKSLKIRRQGMGRNEKIFKDLSVSLLNQHSIAPQKSIPLIEVVNQRG
ncbi:hypothetical protein JW752_00110 [Candidatus Peregrinibacteria bacterium]|nr:hypothetical protein [Candidatus Peregrinibacteria bacterium]